MSKWRDRVNTYKSIGEYDNLITTDDKFGINDTKLEQVIRDVTSLDLKNYDINSTISKHHYPLK